jgi:type IV pilus assembly protein PilF
MNRSRRAAGPRFGLALGLAFGLAGCVPTHLAPGRNASDAASVNVQLAIEYMKLDKLAASREFIDRALEQDPKSPNVQSTAGMIYERLGDNAKAEHAYATAERIGKDDPNIENNYAGFLCRTGRAAEGEKLFLKVVRNPVYSTPEAALVNAGVCVHGAGDVVDAERYFRQALTIRPNMAEALLQLGMLSLDRGDGAQALEFVQRYLAVNPPSPEILWLGLRTERKLGDDTTAAVYGRQLETQFPNSDQARLMRSGVTR